MAAACTLTPAAALPPLLPTPCVVAGVAGRASERSVSWAGNKKPGRASASESWTKDKQLRVGTTSPSSVPGRASLSEDWTKDKAQRKGETKTSVEEPERVGRSSWKEEAVKAKKRAPSRAPSVEVDRSEKKAKPEEGAAEPATVVYYAGPAFLKSPDPREVPLPKFPLLVKSPDPSQVPIPMFLKLKTPKTADDNN
jgi:hypothetical protein